MPTVLRFGPYRLYFYSLARNFGYGPRELGIIEAIVIANADTLLEAWNEFHRA